MSPWRTITVPGALAHIPLTGALVVATVGYWSYGSTGIGVTVQVLGSSGT